MTRLRGRKIRSVKRLIDERMILATAATLRPQRDAA
jgi:hypothetical protein